MRQKQEYDVEAAMTRIHEVTGTRTQVELAAWLDIRQSSISDAKRRKSIPDSWLLELAESAGIAPGWIRTGEGPRYLVASDTPGEVTPGHWTTPPAPAPEPRTISELKAAIEEQLDEGFQVLILDPMLANLLARPAAVVANANEAIAQAQLAAA